MYGPSPAFCGPLTRKFVGAALVAAHGQPQGLPLWSTTPSPGPSRLMTPPARSTLSPKGRGQWDMKGEMAES
jgi:hypothetical protein